ncbi:MAG: TIGR01459 family HAD-type hydrolase [Rhizomicrobium sp.]
MTAEPQLLAHFSEIAPDYDALICDIWGVLHNGATAFTAACDALRQFRHKQGRVILLTNAPRPAKDLEEQFRRFGVPLDCFDAIVTSGAAARDDLARRSAGSKLAMLHLGPVRDRNVFEGLNIEVTDIAHAKVVLCTGPYNDESETPDDYTDMLGEMRARGLTMLCANPDLVVQRGGRLVYCAGALAQAYEKIGGAVVYYGKPHRPIYEVVMTTLDGAKRPLAIGDGLNTDIKGANGMGLDALFIADGIHGEDVAEFTGRHMAELFASAGVHARAAMRALVW